jgi:hypothetical protein
MVEKFKHNGFDPKDQSPRTKVTRLPCITPTVTWEVRTTNSHKTPQSGKKKKKN